MGSKFNQNSRAFYLSEISMSPEVWGMIPSKVKGKLLHLASPTTKKEAQYIRGLCYSGPHTKAQKTASLDGLWDRKRLFNRFKLLYRLLCHLDHMIQQT